MRFSGYGPYTPPVVLNSWIGLKWCLLRRRPAATKTSDFSWRIGVTRTKRASIEGRRTSSQAKSALSEEGNRRTMVSPEESALSNKCVLKNTATSTKWAVAHFERWREGPSRRDRYLMIFYLVGTVLPCASGCLCMLPRHKSKMGLYSRQRVCTCSSQPYGVTCAPRILIV